MAIIYRRLLLLAYFCIINILFCLPGSAFPKDNWLDAIWFDKWVHIGFFALLCYGISWAFGGKGRKFFLFLFLGAAVYGFLVEVVQDQYISNRSFDIGDWIADLIGSGMGIWAWHLWKGRDRAKKIDPCGNRGRNQN